MSMRWSAPQLQVRAGVLGHRAVRKLHWQFLCASYVFSGHNICTNILNIMVKTDHTGKASMHILPRGDVLTVWVSLAHQWECPWHAKAERKWSGANETASKDV